MHSQPDFFYLLINEKARIYASQRIAMHIMAGLFLVFYALQYLPTYNENWMYLVGILPVSILVILLAIFKKALFLDINNNRIFRILETGFLMMACMHFVQTNQYISAILYGFVSLLILYLFSIESRMLQEQYVIFNKEKIQVELPIFTKKIKWSERWRTHHRGCTSTWVREGMMQESTRAAMPCSYASCARRRSAPRKVPACPSSARAPVDADTPM